MHRLGAVALLAVVLAGLATGCVVKAQPVEPDTDTTTCAAARQLHSTVIRQRYACGSL